jgi:hypothetical protein
MRLSAVFLKKTAPCTIFAIGILTLILLYKLRAAIEAPEMACQLPVSPQAFLAEA